jgi:hypothetical protein
MFDAGKARKRQLVTKIRRANTMNVLLVQNGLRKGYATKKLQHVIKY